jgi:5'-3' exoribonuclease 1
MFATDSFAVLLCLQDEARKRGERPDEANRWDSNAITPGTEFMTRLSAHIQYFVRSKLKTDAAWAKIQVIFSGAEVPGEGEHKIMLFIRNMKMQPGYSPNLRHCLYGTSATHQMRRFPTFSSSFPSSY